MTEEEQYVSFTYEIDGVSEWVWRKGDMGGWYFPLAQWNAIRDSVLRHTPGRDLIIQAGGCCGMYPRLWSKYFRIVHTFEPVDYNFRALCKNCPSDNIHKHFAALGDSNKRVIMRGGMERRADDFDVRRKNVGMYKVSGYSNKGVYQIKIDDLPFQRVDAIQLDIEEYEIHALKGAEQTIRKFWPTICVETYNSEVKQFMKYLGYIVVDIAKGNLPIHGDTILRKA